MEADRIACLAAEGKYSFVSPGLILRIAREECPKYKKEKDRLKAVKKRLHIITGAFESENTHRAAAEIVSTLAPGELLGEERLGRICALHASTRERWPDMAEFYGFLNESLSSPESVIDLGCGFAPFCAELLPSVKTYHASDIDVRTVELVEKRLSLLGIGGSVLPLDAVSETPAQTADAAFIFKLFPVLEAQKKGRGFELMSELSVLRYAVSFPLRSLGGRDRGMETFYAEKFEGGLPEIFEITHKATVGTELVYAVKRK